MPRLSERKKFLQVLEQMALLEELLPESEISSSDEETNSTRSESSGNESSDGTTTEEEDDDLFASPLFLLSYFESVRYINRKSSVPKSRQYMESVLPELDDDKFKSEMRVSRDAFRFILNQIQDRQVFMNRSFNKQLPVQDQLSVALYRFGRYGNGASVRDVSAHFGLGEGTVDLVTNRVIDAIMSFAAKYIRWYTSSEKEEVKRRIENDTGFPNCLGFLDGTTMVLDLKPGIDYESYFNRKSRYGLSAQIVSDWDDRIRFLFVGYPASVHDSRCIGYSELVTKPHKFFSNDEYVLADSAYSLSDTIITPFKKPLANTDPSYRLFNYIHILPVFTWSTALVV